MPYTVGKQVSTERFLCTALVGYNMFGGLQDAAEEFYLKPLRTQPQEALENLTTEAGEALLTETELEILVEI